MKISLMVTELWHIQECSEKIIKGQNLVTKKGDQSVLCVTHRPDLINILTKLHEDIPTELWPVQECLEKNRRGITWKFRKWEQSFCA